MFNSNPTINNLKKQNDRQAKKIRLLTTLTARSEYTGGTQGYDFVDLPTPNKAGMIAYCNDCLKSGEGAGSGTGVFVGVTLLAAVLTWVRLDDQTQAAQS